MNQKLARNWLKRFFLSRYYQIHENQLKQLVKAKSVVEALIVVSGVKFVQAMKRRLQAQDPINEAIVMYRNDEKKKLDMIASLLKEQFLYNQDIGKAPGAFKNITFTPNDYQTRFIQQRVIEDVCTCFGLGDQKDEEGVWKELCAEVKRKINQFSAEEDVNIEEARNSFATDMVEELDTIAKDLSKYLQSDILIACIKEKIEAEKRGANGTPSPKELEEIVS